MPGDIKKNNQIIIYKTKTGPRLEVSLKNDTVWLTQKQIADLFNSERSVITKHVRNIFSSGGLSKNAVCAIFAHTAENGKIYQTNFYNLDVIISVGYRVNSKRATQFRIWAIKILKRYLIKAIVLNEKRLKQRQTEQLKDLERTVKLLQQTIKKRELKNDESKALLNLIADYTNSWVLLQKYDEDKLSISVARQKKGKQLVYGEIVKEIKILKQNLMNKKQATDIFGRERGKSLEGILGNIYQTFGGRELYKNKDVMIKLVVNLISK